MANSLWQEVLDCLNNYKEALESSDEDFADDNLDLFGGRLEELTHDHEELFRGMPPGLHNMMWDAIYIGENIHFDRGGCDHDELSSTINVFRSLLTGRAPRLYQLTSWVGHGLGHEGTRAALSQAPATSSEGLKKKALVPGCGQGYDAVSLAKLHGYDVVGLDVSNQAISLAEDYLRSTNTLLRGMREPKKKDWDDQQWAKRREQLPQLAEQTDKVRFILGDFLLDDWEIEAGTDKFDLIYDYQVSDQSPSLYKICSHPLVISNFKTACYEHLLPYIWNLICTNSELPLIAT